MRPRPHVTLAAAVLAGGRSSRMGADKALLAWRGERLVDRQLRLLGRLRPDWLMVSVRPGVDYGRADIAIVPDLQPDLGPLGGLEALLAGSPATHLLVVAVDMPRLTLGFLRALRARCAPGRGVVPRHDGGVEPLAAIYPRECAARFAGIRGERHGAMHALVAAAAAAGEVELWDVPPRWEGVFANWNRPEDVGAESNCAT